MSSDYWPTILLLPASAKRFIQLDQASVFIGPRRCERQFGAVKRPLSVEYFEVCRRAAFVAKRGNADGFLEISDTILLSHSLYWLLVYSFARMSCHST
jgi:hypothetical protein